MYRQLALWLQAQATALGQNSPAEQQQAALNVFGFHPEQLARLLDEAWFARSAAPPGRPSLAYDDPTLPVLPPPPVAPGLRPLFTSFLENWLPAVTTDIFPLGGSARPAVWEHLIYAYIIENTRIYEVFRRVVHEYAHGERLDVPQAATEHWLRTTENLFFKDAPPGTVHSLTSYIRPDIAANRRNAYWRMFGMDLNHGTKDGGAYPYEKAEAANLDFVQTFEKLLVEVWRGIEHVNTTSGPNPTDDSAIANLAEHLFNMLGTRRRNGNLSREELFYVATMSWCHLTVLFDSPIVVDLKATATSPQERLRKIGERVGVPAHSRSESYFRMAEPLSLILTAVEQGQFNTPANVPPLYTPAPGNFFRDGMMTIITHWSIATGRDIKAASVRPSGAAPAQGVSAGTGQLRNGVVTIPSTS